MAQIPQGKAHWDRRSTRRDRRVSPLSMRLRKGLWLAFHRKTELGKFDPFQCTLKNEDKLVAALKTEAVRYTYEDRTLGVSIEPAEVVDYAVEAVRANWAGGDNFGTTRAVMLIEKISAIISDTFAVTCPDRRMEEHR